MIFCTFPSAKNLSVSLALLDSGRDLTSVLLSVYTLPCPDSEVLYLKEDMLN